MSTDAREQTMKAMLESNEDAQRIFLALRELSIQRSGLLGEVAAIKPTLATQQEMLAALGNDALVQALAANSKLIEVRVRLFEDSETPSGYRWTSKQGPPPRLEGWIYCTGTVTVHEQHPIELVFYQQ